MYLSSIMRKKKKHAKMRFVFVFQKFNALFLYEQRANVNVGYVVIAYYVNDTRF